MKWLKFWKRKKKTEQVLGNHEDFVLITWDSCRFDAFAQAKTPNLDKCGTAAKGWAQATYTLPAHVAMFQGFLPHVHEPRPLYNRFCQQLWRISHRSLDITPLVTFPSRTQNIITGFRDRGYLTAGTGAMPHFRDSQALRLGFEAFEFTGTAARRQNEFLSQTVSKKGAKRPWFLFVNYGETHSPFHHEDMARQEPDEVDERFARRRLFNQAGLQESDWEFDELSFARQIECAEFLDARVGELLDLLRERGRPTTVVLCGDHGECFGENGLYGHALYHEKVMEVPMMVFRLNAPQHSTEPLRRAG